MILIFTEALESREHGDSRLRSQAALPRRHALLPACLLRGEEASRLLTERLSTGALMAWDTCIGQPHPKRAEV